MWHRQHHTGGVPVASGCATPCAHRQSSSGGCVQVNLKSAFLMTQRCLGALEAKTVPCETHVTRSAQASKGCVVNVSSIASKRPIPHCLPFCVSKVHITCCVSISTVATAGCPGFSHRMLRRGAGTSWNPSECSESIHCEDQHAQPCWNGIRGSSLLL